MPEKSKEDMLRRMEQEVIEELLHYHEKSSRQKIKDMVKKAAGRYVAPKDYIFWPTGLLVNALMETEAENQKLSAVKAYFDRWIKEGMPVYYVDDVLAGAALIDLYTVTKDENYKKGAERLAEYLFKLSENEADRMGSIPYRPSQKNEHIYVDGVGMISLFLAKYGAAFHNAKAMELALCQIENMLEYGMDRTTGLPYHGYRYKDKIKYGIIGWGRSVGWLMLGMAGVIKESRSLVQTDTPESVNAGQDNTPESCRTEYQKIEMAFQRLTEAIAPYQKANGAFCWQLSAMEGPEDSSATAMIAWALQKAAAAMEEGSSDTATENPSDTGMQILCRAKEFLATCEKNGKIEQCSGECLGFAQYPQIYAAYPWSLAPTYAVFNEHR